MVEIQTYSDKTFSVLSNKKMFNQNQATFNRANQATIILIYYLLTWKVQSFLVKKSTICLAAAKPALLFASEVCAPIFFGVK